MEIRTLHQYTLAMNRKASVIIVDDHQIVIDGIKSILAENNDYKIIDEANNGQEAIDKINASPNKFDLVITDISMPLLSGTDLCKMIKQSYPKKKVLILSTYSSATAVKETHLAGADGFMLKNSGKDELLKALQKITENSTFYSDEIMPVILGQIQKEKKSTEKISVLTKREREILSLIVNEYTSEEISEKLYISKKTVDNHRTHILAKTHSRSIIGLIKFSLKNGIE